MSTVVSFINI